MQNICRDYIFPSFVYSMDLNIDNESLLTDIYNIQKNTESENKSNRGGWQSPSIISGNSLETQNLISLKNEVEAAMNFVKNSENFSNFDYSCYYWININKTNDYNILHNHANSLMSSVYYPYVPDDCESQLIFLRTDAGAYHAQLPELQRNFSVECKTGKLIIFSSYLFHNVTTNNSDKNRVSIAFNFEKK
jgi:uncharacterized protein (TIGR02466 family)